jgi:spore germination protein
MARRLLIVLLLLSLTSASAPPSRSAPLAQPRSLPEGPLRLAYYYPPDPASLASLQTNVSRLELVAPHWWTIDGNGEIARDERPQGFAFVRTSGLIVLPSVMVSSRAAGHAILSDQAVSRVAIRNLVNAVGPWDGLALDFEGLDPDDRADLSRFIRDLGVALREAGKLYLVALPAKSNDARAGWGGAYDFAAIAGAADLYLVMAYGWTTSSSQTPGSTSPRWWVEETMRYAASVFPPNKLLLGLAYYGYDWNVTQGPPARALRYVDAAEIRDRVGASPQLDPRSATTTFRYTDAEGNRHEVWYEDQRGIAAKLELINGLGLRGVGAWRLGQEDPSSWSVWENLRPSIVGRTTPAPSATAVTPAPASAASTPLETASGGWLPTLWAGGGAELALLISNPASTSASLGLTLLNDDGSRSILERQVPGGGQLQLDLGGRSGGDAGMEFRASGPVGVQLRTSRTDGATTMARPVAPASRWIFADGQSSLGIETSFSLLNPGSAPVRVRAVARTAAGGTAWEHAMVLSPEGRGRLVVPQGNAVEFFWTEITSDGPFVAARQTRFAAAAQVSTGSDRPSSRWVVEQASLGEAWQSFLVIANPDVSPAQVTVRWSTVGAASAEQRVEVPAMSRAVVEPTGAASQQVAQAEVTSSVPIVVERAAYERDGVQTSSVGGARQ